ncbi:MAG: hypothetical protein ACI9UV_000410 [Algoriphagus sp.]
MKISKEDFDSLKTKYDKEVEKGKAAKGKGGKDKTDQTNWIFFDGETLEGLLAKADKDPKVGGIQFYFTEYTEETAKKVYPNDLNDYTCQMTLVMHAANLKENKLNIIGGAEDEYDLGAMECPYRCEQEPTSN